MVLGRVPHVEDDGGLGIEALDFLRGKVPVEIEGETVSARDQRRSLRQEPPDAPVVVGYRAPDLPPANFRTDLQQDGHAARRLAPRGVQDVGGNSTHENSFSSRRWVIFRCSSAAMRNSVAGSLSRRARSRPSISAALLPVAQTMK